MSVQSLQLKMEILTIDSKSKTKFYLVVVGKIIAPKDAYIPNSGTCDYVT